MATQGGNGYSLGGGGGELDGGDDPSPIPFEEIEPSIIPFTDPTTGETYEIIDGRVIVALTNPPELPVMDPNYFDVQRPLNDPYYLALQAAMHPCTGDSAVSAFIAAEHLEVYSEWPAIGAIAVLLPPETSVLDAVVSWPQQYPAVVLYAEPDAVGTLDSLANPNDEAFPNQWALNETQSSYGIDVLEAWERGYRGNSGVVVAVLDTGVEYHHEDLTASSTPTGCNVYDNWKSTCFFSRSVAEGGGEPCTMTKSRGPVKSGHGTCVASIIAAISDNDTPIPNEGSELVGAATGVRYFPVGVKLCRNGDWSTCAVLNGLNAIGCTKGVLSAGSLYSGVPPIYYNIEVANMSGSFVHHSTMQSLIKTLTPYIVFVFSTGNNGGGAKNKFPASLSVYPDYAVISVTAHDVNGMRCSYANYAPSTTISAPSGGNWQGAPWIYALDLMGECGGNVLGYQQDPDILWESFGGTSASAPFAAAAAALVICYNPLLTPIQVKARIKNSQGTLPDPQLYDPPIRNIGRLRIYHAIMGIS